jgi:hypothetical protein
MQTIRKITVTGEEARRGHGQSRWPFVQTEAHQLTLLRPQCQWEVSRPRLLTKDCLNARKSERNRLMRQPLIPKTGEPWWCMTWTNEWCNSRLVQTTRTSHVWLNMAAKVLKEIRQPPLLQNQVYAIAMTKHWWEGKCAQPHGLRRVFAMIWSLILGRIATGSCIHMYQPSQQGQKRLPTDLLKAILIWFTDSFLHLLDHYCFWLMSSEVDKIWWIGRAAGSSNGGLDAFLRGPYLEKIDEI